MRLLRIAAVPILLVGIAYPALRPLLDREFFVAHDVFFHISRLHQFDKVLRAGVPYPRWYPDLFSGYGAPIGVFYPPLAYQAAEVPRLLGAGILASWKWVVAAGFVLSGLCQYLWIRKIVGEAGAWVSAIAYIYFPYHILDAYVRGAFPEFVAFIIYPLAAWGMISLGRAPTGRTLALAALPIGALALLHYPSFLLFWPVAIAIGAVGIGRRGWRRGASLLGAALILGTGLAAVAWLPVAAQTGHIRLSLHSPYAFGQFENHFVSIGQIFSRYWGFGASLPPSYEDGMSFQVGWVHLLLGAIGAAFLIRRGGERRRLGILLAALAILGIFLMLRPSDLIWRIVPLIREIQFPWRVLSPLGFILSTLAGAAVGLWVPEGRTSPRRSRIVWAVAAVGGLLLVLYSLPYCIATYRARPVDPTRYPDAYRGSIWPEDLVSRSERLLEGEDLEDALYEDPYFLPVDRESPPKGRPARRVDLAPDEVAALEVEILEEDPRGIAFRAEAAAEVTCRVHIFHYPGWRARIDGEPVEIGRDDETGGMRIAIPAGTHEVRVRFGTTWDRLLGGIISLVAAAAALALLLLPHSAGKQAPRGDSVATSRDPRTPGSETQPSSPR